jgi:biopolymer transport protein ExbD
MENLCQKTLIKNTIMAEILTANTGKGKAKRKILSTRVDLTPMVDLGFLLITFFIFTTTMSAPKAMKLHTPDKGEPGPVVDKYTMNIMLTKNDVIYAHVGQIKQDASNVIQYDYNNIRTAIIDFKKSIPIRDTAYANIIIKPSDSASFKNTIDMVDEMTINDIRKYAKVDMSKEEVALVNMLGVL